MGRAHLLAAGCTARATFPNSPTFHGLRCSEGQQGVLLAGVRGVLQRSAFRFLPAWARIISGTDEGVYGWVALNYLEGEVHSGRVRLAAKH